MFSTNPKKKYGSHFNNIELSSAHASNLDQCKILSFGKRVDHLDIAKLL